jgi:hypothetical protein
MIPTVTILVALLHGSTAEVPQPIFAFTSEPKCAQAAPVVQEGLRFDWPKAITYCERTGAPVSSLVPRGKP